MAVVAKAITTHFLIHYNTLVCQCVVNHPATPALRHLHLLLKINIKKRKTLTSQQVFQTDFLAQTYSVLAVLVCIRFLFFHFYLFLFIYFWFASISVFGCHLCCVVIVFSSFLLNHCSLLILFASFSLLSIFFLLFFIIYLFSSFFFLHFFFIFSACFLHFFSSIFSIFFHLPPIFHVFHFLNFLSIFPIFPYLSSISPFFSFSLHFLSIYFPPFSSLFCLSFSLLFSYLITFFVLYLLCLCRLTFMRGTACCGTLFFNSVTFNTQSGLYE